MIVGLKSFSQNVAINTTGNAAHTSAMLDVASTTKGFLAPRMTTLQRTSIISPADGLMVYDTDTKTFWYFSTTWNEINLNAGGGGGGGSFSLPYTGTGSNIDKLFSITNSSTAGGSVALMGRIGVGSGFGPGVSVGVLGDNTDGVGVLGYSNTGYAVHGYSTNNHSVVGEGNSTGFSGVYGVAATISSYGVLGEAANGHTIGIYGRSSNVGKPAFFEITDLSNPDSVLVSKTVGSGPAIFAQSNNGVSGYFVKPDNSNSSEALRIDHNGSGSGGVVMNMNNSLNTSTAFKINQGTKGVGLFINVDNVNNDQSIIKAHSSGIGGGINIALSNASNTSDALNVSNQGTGNGINVLSTKGQGVSIYNYPNNAQLALNVYNTGTGPTTDIFQSSPYNGNTALRVTTKGTGIGFWSWTDGISPAIKATSTTTSSPLLVDNEYSGAVNSLATFQKNGTNKARIDGTGKGFFNGGTQNSGADVAEAFDVTGDRNEYEAGDVLIISTDADRSVERSSTPYSFLVAGVYATKPGVLLTEENIETDISDKVPMGVVGVIPTKVCIEGGEIKRGDLLVTSSIPGVAMKADIEKIKPGQVIGKALENFDSASVGKIKVLVSVK